MARLSPTAIRIDVPRSLADTRVDRALSLLMGWSRSDAAIVIGQGAVLVDGRSVKAGVRLVEGAVLEVLGEPLADGPLEAEEMPIDVRYEDAHLIVVSKPAGVVVHPGAGRERQTLAAGLLGRFPSLAEVGDPARPGIVHRLDRGTSGLMAVAASPQAYEALVAMFGERLVERTYLALAWGHLDALRGLIDAPVGRSAIRRTRMAVRSDGREARTEYEQVRRFTNPAATLLRCRLETGRTHQVRVHLSAIGHPIVGDASYGGSRGAVLPDRVFLHATGLRLAHPISGHPLAFEDPLPAELEAVLATFGRAS